MKYGFPGNENVYIRDKYVFSYSFKHKQPNWVMEVCPTLIIAHRSTEEFRRSGYDRGHLAAYANHTSNYDKNCTTFFLSNISPQVGVGFNRNIWEQLESHVRLMRASTYEELYACSGMLFVPNKDAKPVVTYEVIGQNRVSVPTHFFKVILGIKKHKIYEIQTNTISWEFIKYDVDG
ncbi:hypothetical protein MXB_204 [Myxobolus squamalis]|nr:hypothetical protein MXB_204 [Myxobolus squamalis]